MKIKTIMKNHVTLTGWFLTKSTILSFGKETSYLVGGNVRCYNQFGKQFSFLTPIKKYRPLNILEFT